MQLFGCDELPKYDELPRDTVARTARNDLNIIN
jgi:hypothetical protein